MSQCNYGDHLEETLCDRFVCSLRYEVIQHRLLSEVDLTYAKAMEIASGMEAADRDTQSFKGSDSILRKLDTHFGRGKETQLCFRCNRSGHNAAVCKFREATCHACGKQGHIAPACRSNNKAAPKPSRQGRSVGKQHTTHQISANALILLKRHVDNLLQWIEPSSPDSLPTDNTIQDNFSYPESSLGTPDETNSEEPALEELFSRHCPR